ncbi:MAG: winged helix-turn-helix domain-containing protein [Acidobacteriaceae bacterium]
MQGPITKPLRIGDWRVDPASGQIARQGERARLEARAMRLLLCLAEHAGEVVSIDDLLDQVWSGVIVSPDSVYQAVTSLRRTLGDDPRQPIYIATVPRLGYRMVATVEPWTDGPAANGGSAEGPDDDGRETSSGKAALRLSSGLVLAVIGAFGVSLAIAGLGAAFVAFLIHGQLSLHRSAETASVVVQPPNAIAVLPFLDLTQGMKEEEFADGMTEELIDKLSKIPGLRVSSAPSSFYFKGKQIPVADIAKSLGVIWVLDGSVRKSGTWIRVDARLMRADNGYVVWSETYDQPMTNLLMVQDDIASAVAKALRLSIGATPGSNP